MRLIKLFALFFGTLFLTATGHASSEVQKGPEHVKIGVFISNLFDVDFARQEVGSQFWIWFNHASPDFDPNTDIEIVNARSSEILDHIRADMGNGNYWDQQKYNTGLDQNWNVANYPFDRQKIRLVIESSDADARTLKFDADVDGTKLRRDLTLAGWKIEGIRIFAANELYETSYGDPTMSPIGPSIYPRVTIEIDVKRNGWRLLLSTFIGFGLAIALAGIVLTSSAFRRLSEVIDIGAQLAVGTGALFSTVGSGYILQSGLPPTTDFGLADAFQLTAFGVTFLTMLLIFVLHVLRKRRMREAAVVTGRVFFVLYLICVAVITVRVWIAVVS